MNDQTFDTSGIVNRSSENGFIYPTEWTDLTPFAQGYVRAMFESLERDNGQPILRSKPTGKIGSGLARFVGFDDLAPTALERIVRDCAALQEDASINDQIAETGGDGRLFWSMRQRSCWARFPPLRIFLTPARKVDLEPQQ